MDEVASMRSSPKPIFAFAAWFSLLGPLLAAGWFCYVVPAERAGLRADPAVGVAELRTHDKARLVALALVFGVGFAAGCVSLWGVRANGALVILPPGLLGILVPVAQHRTGRSAAGLRRRLLCQAFP
jgi:hypothetical protein